MSVDALVTDGWISGVGTGVLVDPIEPSVGLPISIRVVPEVGISIHVPSTEVPVAEPGPPVVPIVEDKPTVRVQAQSVPEVSVQAPATPQPSDGIPAQSARPERPSVSVQVKRLPKLKVTE